MNCTFSQFVRPILVFLFGLKNPKSFSENPYKYRSQNCEFTNKIFFAWKYRKIRRFWQL